MAAVSLPLEQIGKNATGIGHLNANADVDGGTRTEPMVLQYFDQYYPSMSVMLAAKSLNLGVGDINCWVVEGNVGAVEKFTRNGGASIRARPIGAEPPPAEHAGP